MLLMKSIQNTTKNLFHKTVENLKSFFFVGYRKLSKPPPLLQSFSCNGGCSRMKHQQDEFYADFCKDWEASLEEAKMRKQKDSMTLKEQIRKEEEDDDDDECNGSRRFMDIEVNNSTTTSTTLVKIKRQNAGKEEKMKMGSSKLSKGEEQFYYRRNNRGSYGLEQKMKELEIMDVGDVEHVLDVEEALHYYSRLKSPVYLSIVEKFFTDMYSELSAPQPSARINSTSKRRFGSIRL